MRSNNKFKNGRITGKYKYIPRRYSQLLLDLMINGDYKSMSDDAKSLLEEVEVRESRIKSLTWHLHNDKLTDNEIRLIKKKIYIEKIQLEFNREFNKAFNIYEEKTNE